MISLHIQRTQRCTSHDQLQLLPLLAYQLIHVIFPLSPISSTLPFPWPCQVSILCNPSPISLFTHNPTDPETFFLLIAFRKFCLIHKMLKNLASRNQRSKEIKVKLALRTCLVLAVGVWMIYQLRVFLNQKLSSENGASAKGEIQPHQLDLGRKGLLLMDGETRKPDMKEASNAEVEEINKGKQKSEMEEEGEMEQMENLVDGVEKGGDGDDEETETERFDDPMEEIEPLNEDDDGDDEADDNATTQHHSKGEEGSSSQRLNKDETDITIRVAGS